MSRIQLALNVADLQSSIEFYSKLLAAEPSKVRPGYANFALLDPPLKLVLIEQADSRGSGPRGALNHLGVEVESAEEVATSAARLSSESMATEVHEHTTCCYALQDKVWVDDPDLVPWEIYTVLTDAEVELESKCSAIESCIGDDGNPAAISRCC
jgi:catechol 2,3-dioxygenase-like lactoylglutathione lyase family enzyme